MKFKLFTQRIVIAVGLIVFASSVLAAPFSYRLHVDGLACPFCAYGIEKKLGALEGVQSVDTHIRDGAVIVIMQDGFTLDEATARKAVKEAGFSLRKLEPVQSAPPGAPKGSTQ